MNQGKNLQQIAAELQRQLNTRKDFLAEQGLLKMNVTPHTIRSPHGAEITEMIPALDGLNGENKPLTNWAHSQVASSLGVPKQYYDRMRKEAPQLLCSNVNEWLQKEKAEKKLVRTLDGQVRGWLSSKYRPLDNFDLAEVALPTLLEKGCEVQSAEMTETKLYIKAVLPALTTEVRSSKQKGDIVQAGIVISNSEVGAGAVRVEPMIFRLVCLNGMIAADSSLRKFHIGKGGEVDGVREVLTDETKRQDDKAFWMKVQDVIRGAFNEMIFKSLVEKMENAAMEKIDGNVPKVIEVVTERLSLTDATGMSILSNLIEGGDLSRWGLVNAVTKCANDELDYEYATTLERAGGKILELAPSEWRTIQSEAA